jgi:hypothetical protein
MTYPPPPPPPQPDPSWQPADPSWQPAGPASAPPPGENSYVLFDDPAAQPDPSYPPYASAQPSYPPFPQYADPYAGPPPVGPGPPVAGSGQPRGQRTPAVLVGIGIVLALFGLVIILVSPKAFFRGSARDSAGNIPAAEPTTVGDLTGAPFAGSGAPGTPSGPSAQPSTPPEPQRRDVPARTLVGPSFAAGEETYPMGLNGMPFAFYTPKTWGCLKATISGLPDAVVWRCIDEQAGAGRPQIDLAAVKCASACTTADRDNLDKKAMSSPPTYSTKDATTRYSERTSSGKYLLTVNHTFAVDGQNWVLLMDAEASKPEHKPAVQKTINDIWSQTP